MQWTTPAVLGALVLVAVPVLLHLFSRRPVRRVVVPSLALVAARLPRQRWLRRVRDPLLLALRAGVVAAAVAAAAGPLVVSEARRQAWSARTARAIVVDGGARDRARVEAVAAAERTNAFASDVFIGDPLDAAVGRARAWLDRQAPARREVVFVGEGRWGSLDPRVTEALPSAIGLRVRRIESAPPAAEAWLWRGADAAGRLVAATVATTATDGAASTAVEPVTLPPIPVIVEADAADRERVELIRDAVLSEGVFLRPEATWQPLRLRWPSAAADTGHLAAVTDEERRRLVPLALVDRPSAESPPPDAPWTMLGEGLAVARGDDALVVRIEAAPEPALAEAVVRAAIAVAAGRTDDDAVGDGGWWDARLVAAIERPAGAVDTSTAAATVSDGRWLWLAVALGVVADSAWRRRLDPRRKAAHAEGTS